MRSLVAQLCQNARCHRQPLATQSCQGAEAPAPVSLLTLAASLVQVVIRELLWIPAPLMVALLHSPDAQRFLHALCQQTPRATHPRIVAAPVLRLLPRSAAFHAPLITLAQESTLAPPTVASSRSPDVHPFQSARYLRTLQVTLQLAATLPTASCWQASAQSLARQTMVAYQQTLAQAMVGPSRWLVAQPCAACLPQCLQATQQSVAQAPSCHQLARSCAPQTTLAQQFRRARALGEHSPSVAAHQLPSALCLSLTQTPMQAMSPQLATLGVEAPMESLQRSVSLLAPRDTLEQVQLLALSGLVRLWAL
mmetsp:Transcript_31741/g.72442  ORF Transcript_31741/g.72442 Transcript_31741/m.72442 type:complete len:309 (-) Transcript_31741:346-1272(-)